MSIANVVLSAASDIRLKSHVAIHTLAFLAHHADAAGNVGTDINGQPVGDPRITAAALGYGSSSVSKAIGELEKLGYLSWDRASGYERTSGIKGRVRILTSAS